MVPTLMCCLMFMDVSLAFLLRVLRTPLGSLGAAEIARAEKRKPPRALAGGGAISAAISASYMRGSGLPSACESDDVAGGNDSDSSDRETTKRMGDAENMHFAPMRKARLRFSESASVSEDSTERRQGVAEIEDARHQGVVVARLKGSTTRRACGGFSHVRSTFWSDVRRGSVCRARSSWL